MILNTYILSGELVIILKLKEIYKSLGVRVLLIIVIMSIIPISIIKLWLINDYKESLHEQRERRVQTQCNILVNTIASSEYITNIKTNIIEPEISQLTTLYDGRVLILDSMCKIVKDTYHIDEGKISVSENVIKAVKGAKTTKITDDYIQITSPVLNSENKEVIAILVAIFSTKDINDIINDMNNRAWIILLIFSVIISGCAIGFAHMVVKPMKKMQKRIDEIAKGYNDEGVLENR